MQTARKTSEQAMYEVRFTTLRYSTEAITCNSNIGIMMEKVFKRQDSTAEKAPFPTK